MRIPDVSKYEARMRESARRLAIARSFKEPDRVPMRQTIETSTAGLRRRGRRSRGP